MIHRFKDENSYFEMQKTKSKRFKKRIFRERLKRVVRMKSLTLWHRNWEREKNCDLVTAFFLQSYLTLFSLPFEHFIKHMVPSLFTTILDILYLQRLDFSTLFGSHPSITISPFSLSNLLLTFFFFLLIHLVLPPFVIYSFFIP